jgi:hypothetical protein
MFCQQPVDDLSGHAHLVLDGVVDYHVRKVVLFARFGPPDPVKCGSVHPVFQPDHCVRPRSRALYYRMTGKMSPSGVQLLVASEHTLAPIKTEEIAT